MFALGEVEAAIRCTSGSGVEERGVGREEARRPGGGGRGMVCLWVVFEGIASEMGARLFEARVPRRELQASAQDVEDVGKLAVLGGMLSVDSQAHYLSYRASSPCHVTTSAQCCAGHVMPLSWQNLSASGLFGALASSQASENASHLSRPQALS